MATEESVKGSLLKGFYQFEEEELPDSDDCEFR